MTKPIDTNCYQTTEGCFACLTIERLSIAEQLIIWAFRNRLMGGSEAVLKHGFQVAFGFSGMETALASFKGVYDTIFNNCRRDLGFHAARCRCVSSDEIFIVGLIAAKHAGLDDKAHQIGRALVWDECVGKLMDHAGILAILMQRNNLHLPLRPLTARGDERPTVLH